MRLGGPSHGPAPALGHTQRDAVQEPLKLADRCDRSAEPTWPPKPLEQARSQRPRDARSLLWLLSQTRAFHYRYEIWESGYLVDHEPLLVDYPNDWRDDATFQELINGWANQGLGQHLVDDKPVLTHLPCHQEHLH